MADPRLLEAYLRMSPEEARRRESEQLRDWFSEQQEIRQSKLGESLGVGDLALLAKPAATTVAFLADTANRLLSVPANEEYMQGVVPRAVKVARRSAVAARPPDSTPRRDLVAPRIYDKYGPAKLGEKYLEPDERSFFGNPNYSRNLDFLVGGYPKAGVSITKENPRRYTPASEIDKLTIDVSRRPNLPEMRKMELERRQWDESFKKYQESADHYYSIPYEQRAGLEFPRFPTIPPTHNYATIWQTPFEPASIKALGRGLAAFYPEKTRVGGHRITGVRTNRDYSKQQAEIPLPRLSETAAQKERSQLSRFLNEILNERAANRKSKTAGR